MMEVKIKRTAPDELKHFGIKGQRWGIRRFENPDGTLTPEGMMRYRKAKEASEKYKTAGSRVSRTITGGLVSGGLTGAGTLVGLLATGSTTHSLLTGLGGQWVAGAAGLGAIGGLAATALVQGAHAIKVRRGLNFMNRYEAAYRKTMKQEQDSLIAENKEAFDRSMKSIRETGVREWWDKNAYTNESDKFFNHVFDNQYDLLNSWWNERYKTNSEEERSGLQQKYIKQLAKNLHMPQTRDTYEFLEDWFINGDD